MDRSEAQTKQAQLWAGIISSTNLNAVWNNVARDTVLNKRLDLVEAARVFALMDVSMNDSILTSHSSKFIYGLWRPWTAIRNADLDLNPDTVKVGDWETLIPTPSYPSYGGNMACVGAGAAKALALAFDTDDVPITVVWKGNANSTPPNTDTVKEFTGFWQLAVDEADSRVFGGIHFRFDNDAARSSVRRSPTSPSTTTCSPNGTAGPGRSRQTRRFPGRHRPAGAVPPGFAAVPGYNPTFLRPAGVPLFRRTRPSS